MNNYYSWVAVGSLLAVIICQLYIIRQIREIRYLRTRIRNLHRRSRRQKDRDEALLRSAKNTIEALDEDFDAAVRISVEQVTYLRGLVRGLAREIREHPGFDSHVQFPVEGCRLCDLVKRAEQA